MEDSRQPLPAFARSIEYLKPVVEPRKGSRPVCMTLMSAASELKNASYAKRNQTYGLTTLRRKHVDIENTS
jgi:DNA topoisomerase IB